MSRFAFRAQAALDLRRRREEEAQRARAEAETRLERAERAVEDLRAALDEGCRQGAGVHDPGMLTWYRNWITGQHQGIAKGQDAVRNRRADVDAAVTRAQAAHRDVRALERLRERAWTAWQEAERQREQKDMDWLGTVRHSQQRARAAEEE